MPKLDQVAIAVLQPEGLLPSQAIPCRQQGAHIARGSPLVLRALTLLRLYITAPAALSTVLWPVILSGHAQAFSYMPLLSCLHVHVADPDSDPGIVTLCTLYNLQATGRRHNRPAAKENCCRLPHACQPTHA